MDILRLCDEVREVAYAIHVYFGQGHLEKVYENSLAHRLRKAGHVVRHHDPLRVFDEDGTLVGSYYADVLVDAELIIELKAARTIAPEHEAQILGYLRAARKRHGMLINFGSYRFQVQKFVLG